MQWSTVDQLGDHSGPVYPYTAVAMALTTGYIYIGHGLIIIL